MRNLVSKSAKPVLAVAGLGVGAVVLQLVDPDAGWTESLSAVATAGATVVALWIATRDRSERKDERLDADRAQARLVLLEVEGPHRGKNDYRFIVTVEANGSQPILDVAFESAQFVDGLCTVDLVGPSGIADPMVRPGRAPATIFVAFPTRDATPTEVLEVEPNDYGEWLFPEHLMANVVATVLFTDAGGNRWRRSTSGLVELLKEA